MDLLRQALDKIGDNFNKGEKYAPLHALYEAPDTILYTPKDVTSGASHVRDGIDLKRMMITVVFALMPCLLWGMYNTGYQAATAVGHGALPWDGWQTVVFEALGFGSLWVGEHVVLPVGPVVVRAPAGRRSARAEDWATKNIRSGAPARAVRGRRLSDRPRRANSQPRQTTASRPRPSPRAGSRAPRGAPF